MSRKYVQNPPAGQHVQTRYRREVHISAKVERQLAGQLGFLGGVTEGPHALTPSERPHWLRAQRAYYARHPTHPGQPVWREWSEDFVEALDANDQETVEAFSAYRKAHDGAINAWRAANPQAVPIHPLSAYWRDLWDLAQPDWQVIVTARREFLSSNTDVLRPMLDHPLEPVRRQLAHFMHEHFESLNWGVR